MANNTVRMLGFATAVWLAGSSVGSAADEITVAYFPEWTLPFEFAKVSGEYEKELGVKINWRAFDTGTAIAAAISSGDVQLAIGQSIPNFVVTTSAGSDIQMVDIAVSYSGNNNCVVSSALDIDKNNVKELEGKKVALPLGTSAQYDFLKQMEHFGVNAASMQIVDMAPPDAAAALSQGNVDMACGYGGGLQRMMSYGEVLLTGDEKDALGIRIYDLITASPEFVDTKPELVAKFLKVTHDMNARWNSGDAQKKEMLPVIAKDAGMDLKAAESLIAGFKFPTADETLSSDWLGGATQKTMNEIATFFLQSGNIPKKRDQYDDLVNTGPLQAAKGM